MYQTLISPAELAAQLDASDWVIADVRFSLGDPQAGHAAYATSHIPGALYAHLDEDLSGPIVPGETGRHPLPAIGQLVQTFTQWGISEGTQVVAYDDKGGAIAARLWWLLRWMGHEAVAVLDGGWTAWLAGGHPISNEREAPMPRNFVPRPRPELLVEAEDILETLGWKGSPLLDARAAVRYRGEEEPLDPVAGHIPGAQSAPFAENLDEQGRFLRPEQLQARFLSLLGEADPENTICYCGSGITACHNLLAMAHAGLGDAKLYAGSWSEWITDPDRPIAKA